MIRSHTHRLLQTLTTGLTWDVFNTLVQPAPFFAEARCRDRIGPDVFFNEASERGAKSICALCPVRKECLDFALDNDEREGVWGGTSPAERRRLRRQHPPAAVSPNQKRRRHEQVAAMTRDGFSAAEIARRLDVTQRQVVRDRAAIREQKALT